MRPILLALVVALFAASAADAADLQIYSGGSLKLHDYGSYRSPSYRLDYLPLIDGYPGYAPAYGGYGYGYRSYYAPRYYYPAYNYNPYFVPRAAWGVGY